MEEDYVVSKEDLKIYFGNRLIISGNEYIEYLNFKCLNDEKGA